MKAIHIQPHHKKQLERLSIYLRELRFSENMTQQEVSKESSLHHNTILRAENGKNITLTSLFVLAEMYDIPPSELLSIID